MGAVVLLSLALNPELLDRDRISGFLNGLGPLAFVTYIVICLTRAVLLIPSTPFVLAGSITFPDWPIAVFIVSVIGILAGALLIYSFPKFGSYDEYLEEKYPEKIGYIKEKMRGEHAYWIVMGWSAFPLVPTDLICYVAGIARMSYNKMASAVVIGELPIIILYIVVGMEFGEWLRG